MKNFLPRILLLPLIACASLQKSEKEQESDLFKGNSCYFKPGRVKQEVLNNAKASKTVSDPMLLWQMIQFWPGIQPSLLKTSQEGREVMSKKSYFLEDLANRLGINRLKQLPVHSDLKVFDNFEFPKTPMGKAEAVSLVHRITNHILFESSIKDPLLEIFYEEILDLTLGSEECLIRALSLSNFKKKCHMRDFILYAFKKNRVNELIKLKRAIPSIVPFFWGSILNAFFEDSNFDIAIVGLSSHFSKSPEDYRIVCTDLSDIAIISLLCSDLPMEKVGELLHDALIVSKVEVFNYYFYLILTLPLNSAIPNQDMICSRLLVLLDHFKSLRANELSEFDLSIVEDMKFLAKCRYESYHLTEEGIAALNTLGTEALKVYLFSILLSTKAPEEALQFLPANQITESSLNEKLAENDTFCALLAERAPEWVKMNFHRNVEFVCRDLNLFKAFFGVSSISEFLQIATYNDIRYGANIVFNHGNMEEIRDMAEMVEMAEDSLVIGFFQNILFIKEDRFAEILKILVPFVLRVRKNLASSLMYLIIDIHLTLEIFLRLVEKGGIELIMQIYNSSSYSNEQILSEITRILARILSSAQLSPRILPFQTDLLAWLAKNCTENIVSMYNPDGIFAGSKFFNLHPVDFITIILKHNSIYANTGSFCHFFMIMVSLSRSWFLANPQIANYTGEDFVQKALDSIDEENASKKEFCQVLYSSLTPRGKSILRFIFAEAEKFKPAPPLQPADNVENA